MSCSQRRIWSELQKHQLNPLDTIKIYTINDDLCNLGAIMRGPKETPYEGGFFRLKITVSEDYPFKPPKIQFITKIYHPNVSLTTGLVWMDALFHEWSPALTIDRVLLMISGLLSNPNAEIAMESEIAHMYKTDLDQYNSIAKAYKLEYASQPLTQENLIDQE